MISTANLNLQIVQPGFRSQPSNNTQTPCRMYHCDMPSSSGFSGSCSSPLPPIAPSWSQQPWCSEPEMLTPGHPIGPTCVSQTLINFNLATIECKATLVCAYSIYIFFEFHMYIDYFKVQIAIHFAKILLYRYKSTYDCVCVFVIVL